MIDIIKAFVPDIIALAEIKDSAIIKSLDKYKRRNEGIKISINEVNRLIKPNAFYDWILLAHNGDCKAASFVKFANLQAKELLKNIEPELFDKVRSTVKKMLLSVDSNLHQINNPVYINYFGEVLGLNHLLRTTVGRFKLDAIEQKLENGKRIDFALRNLVDNELVFGDFFSIHNIDFQKVSVDQELIDFFESRFNQKLENKTVNLNESFHRIQYQEEEVNFVIFPIVWIDVRKLLPFKEVFTMLDKKYINVFPCYTLGTEELVDKSFRFTFCEVSHLLNNIENI